MTTENDPESRAQSPGAEHSANTDETIRLTPTLIVLGVLALLGGLGAGLLMSLRTLL